MGQLKKWRRDLHQIPELGMKEYQTAAYIRNELGKMGYQYENVVETGTIVFIDYGKVNTIAFRSDIDALPIEEMNNVDYKSKHEGCMHACGHDGHMSAMLGFAKHLKEHDYDFNHNILLIFQPAEETIAAARFIVSSGVFEKYNVKAVFGMHLMPDIDEGIIACKDGALMALCGDVNVTIVGQDAHAGFSHQGIDSIAIACDLLQQYQNMVARRVSRFSPVLLNIGKIEGGTSGNCVASTTKIEGTLRCFDEALYEKIVDYILDIHHGLEKTYSCQILWSPPPVNPPVINDHDLYQQFINIVDDHYLELTDPLMTSEDFSYYQKAIPGLFFFLGTKCKEYHSGLHTNTFNFHEEVLEKAIDMYLSIAQNINV
ncbi:MAG: M20 family metallopeptidase [Erysipelotrichaceae bacterium]|nr:M20 family metallopeptidase [Erysipelotrichaceae bacterium]